MKFLFGIPHYLNQIDPTSYQKDKIVSVIEENYRRSSLRNSWEANIDNKIHQSYQDEQNEKFLSIDYSELIPIYTQEVDKFLHQLPLKNPLPYRLEITNYTATKNDQSLLFHHHIPSLFYCIHYLKFDPKVHNPTLHQNSHRFADYLSVMYSKELFNIFDDNYVENSWLYTDYSLKTQEDDFLIVPSTIFHKIKESSSDLLRCTIAMNVYSDTSEQSMIQMYSNS